MKVESENTILNFIWVSHEIVIHHPRRMIGALNIIFSSPLAFPSALFPLLYLPTPLPLPSPSPPYSLSATFTLPFLYIYPAPTMSSPSLLSPSPSYSLFATFTLPFLYLHPAHTMSSPALTSFLPPLETAFTYLLDILAWGIPSVPHTILFVQRIFEQNCPGISPPPILRPSYPLSQSLTKKRRICIFLFLQTSCCNLDLSVQLGLFKHLKRNNFFPPKKLKNILLHYCCIKMIIKWQTHHCP